MKILATEYQPADILHDKTIFFRSIISNYIWIRENKQFRNNVTVIHFADVIHLCSPLNHLQIHNFSIGCIKKIKEAATFSKAKNICDISF